MNVFELFATLALQSGEFEKGLNDAEKKAEKSGNSIAEKLKKIETALKGSAALIALEKLGKAVYSLASDTAAAGDAIDKNSQKLGISKKAYQQLDYVLSQNGSSITSMNTAFRTMSNGITKGSKSTKDAIKQLGLSYGDLKKQNAEEQFNTIVTALQGCTSESEKLSLATTLFGRSAQDLMPLLNQQAGSMDKLKQKANELGMVMSDEDVANSAAFTDALDDMSRAWNGIKRTVGAWMLPGIAKAFEKIAQACGKVTKALKSGDWSEITADLGNMWDNVLSAIGLDDDTISSINTIFGDAFGGVSSIVDGITGTFGNIWSSIVDVLNGDGTAAELIGGAFDAVFGDSVSGTGIMGMASRIAGSFTTLATDIYNAVTGDAEGAAKLTEALDGIFLPLMTVGDSLSGTFSTLLTNIAGWISGDQSGEQALSNIWNDLIGEGGSLTTLWSGLQGVITGVANAASNFITGKDISEVGSELWSTFVQPVIDAFNSAKDAISNVLTSAQSLLDGSGITAAAQATWNAFILPIKNAMAKASGAIAGVVSWLQKLFGYDGKSVNVNVGVGVHQSTSGENHGGGTGHFATGENYVPFDNFPAMLHKGQAVLNAAEARKWRSRGQMGSTYNDTNMLYVGNMYMSSEWDVERLQNEIRTITRRRNAGYGVI